MTFGFAVGVGVLLVKFLSLCVDVTVVLPAHNP